MKIHFKKGYNKKKPKRWYVFGDKKNSYYYCAGMQNINNLENSPICFSQYYGCSSFKIYVLKNYGISLSKDQKYAYDQSRLYVYFRCRADEAAFILKYSNGIEIDKTFI